MHRTFLLLAVLTISCTAGEASKELDAAAYLAKATEAQPKFEELYKQWVKLSDSGAVVPRDMYDKLNKSFSAWIVPDQHTVRLKLRQLFYRDKIGDDVAFADEIIKHCEFRLSDDAIANYFDVRGWYLFALAYATQLKNQRDTITAWDKAWSSTEVGGDAGERQRATTIKKMIADCSMRERIRQSQFDKALEALKSAESDSDTKSMFEEESGWTMRLAYASAIAHGGGKTAADYNEAFQIVRKQLAAQRAKTWRGLAGNASSATLAILLEESQPKQFELKLEWPDSFDVAHGYSLNADVFAKFAQNEQSKSAGETASRQLLASIEWNKRVLAELRAPKTDFVMRLQYEPYALLEVAAANVKLKNYQEAMNSYCELLLAFSMKGRSAWMPDRKAAPKAYTPAVAAAVNELEKPKGGLLPRARDNFFHVLKVSGANENDPKFKDVITIFGKPPAGALPFTDEPAQPKAPETPDQFEQLKALTEAGATAIHWTPTPAGGFAHRFAPKELLLKKYGGSKATEEAVSAALKWLARNQEPDGHWSAVKSESTFKTDTAVTGFALLAFLSAGNSEKTGTYADNVKRAITWMRSKQDAKGMVFDKTDAGAHRGEGYPCGIAALALIEAASMSNLPESKAAAQKAVEYVEAHQNDTQFGWRYSPKSVGDLSVSGWHISALKSAKVAGLNVKATALDNATKFLDSVEQKEKSTFGYMKDRELGHGGSNHRLTAIGALCRRYLGAKPEDVQKSVDAFVKKGGNPHWGNGATVDLYYWYYATLITFQQGGEVWDRWNEAMKKSLVENQIKEGNDAGSWKPVGDFSAEWGRVGQTALAALCLEVYYRYPRMGPK